IAFRIERRLPAFRRGERQLNAGILEYEIGGSEFLKPETSRAARVPQLVVRCQDHQYFHIVLPYSSRGPSEQKKVPDSRRSLPVKRYERMVTISGEKLVPRAGLEPALPLPE